MKLVYTSVSKTDAARCVGSNPSGGTKQGENMDWTEDFNALMKASAKKAMTKEEAKNRVVALAKEGIQWHDQGMGHGHYEFHLSDEEFIDLFEALKAVDGIK